MNDREALVLINSVDGIGSVRLKKLLEAFGEPSRIFGVDVGQLTATGALTPLMARRLLDAPRRFEVGAEMEKAQKLNIRITTILDGDYPAILKEIYDPPFVLYIKGELMPCDRNAVAVVGSRGASYYGLSCAKEFSYKLALAGVTIVSGMARGIDTAGHRAALDAGGRTLAVLGSGLKKVYPPENKGLFQQIAEKGAVISQFPLDTPPLPQYFPIRNRVISGLSCGVLVVEASNKSGALITARYALDQGREIFAVPGKVSSATSLGTNDLIKQGAKMVTEPAEILDELRCRFSLESLSSPASLKEESTGLSSEEQKIVKNLGDEPISVDDLAAQTGLNVSDLLSILVKLELRKVIKQLPGKTFVKS